MMIPQLNGEEGPYRPAFITLSTWARSPS